MFSRPTYRWMLLAVLAAALAIRLAAGVWWQQRLPAGRQFGFPDSEGYWELGRAIAQGRPYEYGPERYAIFRTPGYPLLLAGLFAIGGNDPPVMLARALSAVLGTAAVAGVASLAKLLFDERTALFAAAMAAVYPEAIALSVFVLSEAPLCPLLVWQLVAWTKAWSGVGVSSARSSSAGETPTIRWAAVAGVLAGLATLMRPSWLLFVPFAGGIGLIAAVLRRNATEGIPFSTVKQHLVVTGVMLIAMCVTLSPWWIRNYSVAGRFVPTTLQVGASLYDGLGPQATGASDMRFVQPFVAEQHLADAQPGADGRGTFENRLDRRMRDASLAWVGRNPGRAVELVVIKFRRMWSPLPNAAEFGSGTLRLVLALTYTPVIALALVGAWKYVRSDWPYLLCLLPAVYFTALHVIFVSSIRYRQPAMLVLIVLAAAVVGEWAARARRQRVGEGERGRVGEPAKAMGFLFSPPLPLAPSAPPCIPVPSREPITSLTPEWTGPQPQPEPRPPLVRRLCGELKRLAVLAVLGAAVFVAGKYYCVDRLNEEIRQRAQQQLADHYQGLGVSIYSARRIAGQGVELRGIEIRDGQAADSPVLVHIDEVFAECDTRLPDFVTKPPQIVRLQFRRLKLRAQRQPDGYWNLSRLLPLPGMGSGGPAPSATITDASLEIIDPLQQQATPLTLRNIELVVQPQASTPQAETSRPPGWLQVKGSLAGDHLERVEIDGLLDPRSAAWEVRGAVEGLEFNPRLRTALPREIAALLQPLSTVRGRTYLGFFVRRNSRPLTPSGARQSSDPAPLEFVVSGKISEGRIDDARLPEPLSDVEATIRADNHGLTIQDMSARCGRAQLSINAELLGFRADSPLTLDLQAKQLEVERLNVPALPEAARKVFADFSPAGLVDLTARLQFDGRIWHPELKLTCHDLSVQYIRFPYRMSGGVGTIQLKDDRLTMRLRLLAGGQYVQCRAEVHRPGPAFTGWIEVGSEGPVPVDRKLLDALEPRFQKIVRAFRPQGNISFQGRLQRGASEPLVHRKLHVTLHDCSVQHDKFAYPIDKVNGSLQLTNCDWLFCNLTGRNDSAYITGEGRWLTEPADGNQLTLEFRATDVPLADELRQALAPGVQRLWANLRPRGNIDHLAVGLKYNATANRLSVDVKGEKWPPGQNIEGRTLSIEPTWFRYRMDNLVGSIHYQDGLMELTGLAASHGKATIEADGLARVLPDGGCRLQLTRLAADRLESDHELIAALPPDIGSGLGRLAVEGPVNVLGTLGVTVPGHPDAVPEIDWDLEFDLESGRLATPTPVEHVHGGLRLIGGSGPRGAGSRGELTIDSAVIRDVHITQISGPLLIDGQRVIFGAAAERQAPGRVPRPITANAFEGQLSLDGELRLSEAGEFQVEMTLDNGDLAAVVSEVAPRQRGLSGRVFGGVNMTGSMQGVHTWRGMGQARLRDADIYELPVMIAMLSLLRVQRPDRTAFTTSQIDFRIEGDDLALERIDFSGDLLCLKGKGRITGQREVDLKFYPQFGRDELHLPFMRPFVGEASRQFMLIEVTGTLDRQDVTRTVFPRIDERLAELFPELARQAGESDAPVPILNMPREALERAGVLPRR